MHRSPLAFLAPGLSTVALVTALAGCDTPNQPGTGRDVPRDGQVTKFDTDNTDTSFLWKGCEPPWGNDPYSDHFPPEEWGRDLRARIEIDAPALVTDAWIVNEGRDGHPCDAGCGSIDLGWTGDVMVRETSHEIVSARAFGWCSERAAAYSVEVQSESSFQCSCM